MKQVLVDMYRVEFNDVRRLTVNGPYIVTHGSNPEDYIVLNPDNKSIVVGEPYLIPLEKYGGGFKNKELIERNCCWVGSNVAGKVANNAGMNQNKGRSYRMVEV